MPAVFDIIDEWRYHVDDRGGSVPKADDEVDPFWVTDAAQADLLWTNKEALRYLQRALTEIGVRRHGWEDVTTASDSQSRPVCTIPLVSGTATYAYSPLVLTIENMVLSATGQTVYKTTPQRLDRLYFESRLDWRSESGDVWYYIENVDERTITLYGNPNASGSLRLKVRRLPLYAVDWPTFDSNMPELENEQLREAAIEYMSYRAYSKRDADSEFRQRSIDALEKFTQLVGPPVDEKMLLAWRANANLDMSIVPSTYEYQMRRHSVDRNPFIADRLNGRWGLGDN